VNPEKYNVSVSTKILTVFNIDNNNNNNVAYYYDL